MPGSHTYLKGYCTQQCQNTTRKRSEEIHFSSPQMIGTGSFPYELSLSAPAGWCCRAEAAADATHPPLDWVFLGGVRPPSLDEMVSPFMQLCT